MVEAGLDVLEGKRAHAGGSEFDGERHSVQAAAQRAEDRDALLAEDEIRAMFMGTFEEQLHGLSGQRVVAGEGERRDSIGALASEAQGFSAGGQNVHSRTRAHEGVNELYASVDEVLAVVEQQEETPTPQGIEQGLHDWATRLVAYSDRAGGGACHEFGIAKRGEVDEPDPVPRAV